MRTCCGNGGSGRVVWTAGIVVATLLGGAAPALGDGLRVATWNITFYDGGFEPDIARVVYGQFQGRSMSPDAIVVQEFRLRASYDDFLRALNAASGSPGDWTASPYRDGTGMDTHLFFRASKLRLIGQTVVAAGGPSPDHPRDPMRYDVQPVGYIASSTVLSIYSAHFQAGSTAEEQVRRHNEAKEIRANAASLPAGRAFLFGADFNVQDSGQAAYFELLSATPPSDPGGLGRFFDPISTPGAWRNNPAFRFVHTQDPVVGGTGMDDRYDQLLISAELFDGIGIDYIGSVGTPFSTTTWNDPNHSYRAFGNDGSTFNQPLATTSNAFVGPDIARSIQTLGKDAGHIPVYLDLRMPAKLGADVVLDLGDVRPGQMITLPVWHAGNVNLWGPRGLADLSVELAAAGPGLDFAPATRVVAPTGSAAFEGRIVAAPGPLQSSIIVESNDPDRPFLLVFVQGTVLPPCEADVTGDGQVDSGDLSAFITAFLAGAASADITGDGQVDSGDLSAFIAAFVVDC